MESVVGAFVGEELRAEQKVVLANGRSYATLERESYWQGACYL